MNYNSENYMQKPVSTMHTLNPDAISNIQHVPSDTSATAQVYMPMNNHQDRTAVGSSVNFSQPPYVVQHIMGPNVATANSAPYANANCHNSAEHITPNSSRIDENSASTSMPPYITIAYKFLFKYRVPIEFKEFKEKIKQVEEVLMFSCFRETKQGLVKV